MSQDEFKMMEEDDDDDIPDLESVASSEYLDSDEDDLQYEIVEENELQSPNYYVSKKWLESTNLRQQFDILIIYTYSPFLYGEHIDPVHWDKQWFSWFRKANLISERPFNLDQLSIREIRVLEILELSFDWCWEYFGPSKNISCLEEIINLWEVVKDEKILKTAITAAKSQKWFRDILNLIDEQPSELKLNNKEFQDSSAIELCCLYAVTHLGYQLLKADQITDFNFVDDLESKREITHTLHDLDIKSNLEKAEVSFVMFERLEYLEYFRKAIRLNPFNISAYESRLEAHLLSNYDLEAASDSIRLICLDRNHKEAYLSLLRAFQNLREIKRAELIQSRYSDKFFEEDDKTLLQKVLDGEIEPSVINYEKSDNKSFQDYKDLRDCARQGSIQYKNDNYENAHLYYGVCMKTAREKPNWRHAMSWKDGALFMLAVQYCYAQSLLSMEKYQAALDSFLKLRRYHKLYPFPAAHLYAAQASMKLRRYCEARQNIEAGLKLCDVHGSLPLRWPATDDPISECLPQQVKIELLKLQAQIVHECEAIATCRYTGCLVHNISRQIIREDPDFKGYTLMRCSEKCSIGFHPTCWRRFKTSHTEHSNEKNLISTPCVTPDCPGKVTHIVIYETGPKPKYEVSVEESKPNTPEDETKPTFPPPFSKSDSQDKRKRSHYSSLTSPIEPEKGNLEKAVRQQEKENITPVEPVKQKPITEDDRKSEDSVGVINRHAEEDKDLKQTKTKKKKKNKQSKEATTKENSCKWDDLFMLPERKGMLNESSETNQEFPSWEPDPDAPFSVPEHLKDKVSQYESGKLQDEESQHSDVTKEPPQISSPDYDYAISYFVEVFKSHGPLHPMDSILSESLQLLPENSQKLIDTYGDLSDFLLSSQLFRTFVGGAKIGLKEDRALIVEALHSSHSKFPELSELVKEHCDRPKKKPNFSLTENDHEATLLPTMSPSSSSSGSPPLSSKNNKKGKQKNSKEMKKEIPSAPVVSKVDEHSKTSESNKENDKVSTTKETNKVSSIKETNRVSTTETQSGTSKNGHETGGRSRNDVKTKSSNEKSKKSESFVVKKGLSDMDKTVGVGGGEGVNGTSVAMETKQSCDPDVVKPEVVMRDVEIQTESTLHVHQCVNTDPQPVVESFKERYEEVKKEKMSLEKKLEVSEDMRVKLQKQSSRELEKTIKKANKEKDDKISQMEESVKEEKEKLSRERKEVNELVKTTKNEMKILNEKINKLKKDVQRKEKEKNESVSLLQDECEHLTKDKKKLEEHYAALVDAKHHRAVEAEVQLLTQRKDSILKPGEQRLQELERLCIYASQALPGGEPELTLYKEQVKTALEGYKNALDDQIRKVRSGEQLNQLEVVPAPSLPMSPQLRMRAQLVQRSLIVSLQRGATSIFPTAPLPVSMANPTSLDPAAILASTPQPQPAMAPTFPTALNTPSIEFLSQPMTSGLGLGPSGLGMNMGGMGLAGYGSNLVGLNTGLAGMTPSAAPSNLGINHHGLSGMAPTMTGTGDLSGTGMGPIMTVSNNLSGIGTGTINVTAGMGFNGTGMGLVNTMGTNQSGTVPSSKSGNATEKGNFDQLVATLAPLYPKYTRDDFKLAVLELRQRQKMSLTGLPLGAVIEKVKEVIDARENQSSLLINQMPSLPSMPVHSLTQPVQNQGPMLRVNSSQLPPPPPPIVKPSEVEYNEDNSCIICYEEMDDSDSDKLECGHIFHKHCIRSWLNEQKTCPTCRNYALLPDEFPHLH